MTTPQSIVVWYIVSAVVLYYGIFKKMAEDFRYEYEHDETDIEPKRWHTALVTALWLPFFVVAAAYHWLHRKEPKE